MMVIVTNEILRQIHVKHAADAAAEVLAKIEEVIFFEREKTFTRIKNNKSQPTLSEAALIAEMIGCSIDDIIKINQTVAA
jgi:predicted NodU family carbamoyl transferase